MSCFYGIFHPESETPIGQVYLAESDAAAALTEIRDAADSFAGVPMAGIAVEATYVPFFAACYVAPLDPPDGSSK